MSYFQPRMTANVREYLEPQMDTDVSNIGINPSKGRAYGTHRRQDGRWIMKLKAEAKRWRIFLGAAVQAKHTALYEAIVRKGRPFLHPAKPLSAVATKRDFFLCRAGARRSRVRRAPARHGEQHGARSLRQAVVYARRMALRLRRRTSKSIP